MNAPTQKQVALALDAQRPADVIPYTEPVTPMAMIDRALSSGAGVDVIERLMMLQERWEANQGRKAFDNAMSDAKAELPAIVKTQTANRGNAGSYKYEDLAQIAAQIDPVLSRHGLSYRFRTDTADGRIRVTCIVSHRDGYSESTSLESGADTSGSKNPIQAMGSAVTYLQRYTLKAALGLAAAKDDDTKQAAAPKAEAMTADEYRKLRAAIDADSNPERVEEYILGKTNAETLADLSKRECADAIAFLEQRAKKRAEQGGA